MEKDCDYHVEFFEMFDNKILPLQISLAWAVDNRDGEVTLVGQVPSDCEKESIDWPEWAERKEYGKYIGGLEEFLAIYVGSKFGQATFQIGGIKVF